MGERFAEHDHAVGNIDRVVVPVARAVDTQFAQVSRMGPGGGGREHGRNGGEGGAAARAAPPAWLPPGGRRVRLPAIS